MIEQLLQYQSVDAKLREIETEISQSEERKKADEIMNSFIMEKGYENDINPNRLHHEIYISDPNKTATEKLKTVIRHPIKNTD